MNKVAALIASMLAVVLFTTIGITSFYLIYRVVTLPAEEALIVLSLLLVWYGFWRFRQRVGSDGN